MSRRPLISTGDLRKFAKIVREEGVAFRGRLDSMGNLSFQLSPDVTKVGGADDDLDSRLDEFGAL